MLVHLPIRDCTCFPIAHGPILVNTTPNNVFLSTRRGPPRWSRRALPFSNCPHSSLRRLRSVPHFSFILFSVPAFLFDLLFIYTFHPGDSLSKPFPFPFPSPLLTLFSFPPPLPFTSYHFFLFTFIFSLSSFLLHLLWLIFSVCLLTFLLQMLSRLSSFPSY